MCGALSEKGDAQQELGFARELINAVAAGFPRARIGLHMCRGNWTVDESACLAGSYAPLLPTQCDRIAQRARLGIARLGGVGEHTSGDLFFAFSTANRGLKPAHPVNASPVNMRMLPNDSMTPLFDAVVEATEEAIVNAMLGAETMTGRDGITAHRLEPELLCEAMRL